LKAGEVIEDTVPVIHNWYTFRLPLTIWKYGRTAGSEKFGRIAG